MDKIQLTEQKWMGKNISPLIIAEIGNNHNGDLNIAFELIKNAKDVGVDAVKFQVKNIEKSFPKELLDSPYVNENSFGNTYREHKLALEFSEEELHYELCEEIAEWCSANSEQQCKIIFQKLKKRKISIGVFIKAILKINNIAAEFEKLFQYNLPMLGKLREIPRMTLKFVVTNQSLYI